QPPKGRCRLLLCCVPLVFCGMPLNGRADLKGELAKFQDRCIELRDQAKKFEGQAVAQKFVARALELHGENHDATATALHELAWFTQQNGDFDCAEKLWWRALAIDENLHGKDSPETCRRLNLLGAFYRERGDFNRAREFLLRALKIREQNLGKNDPLTGYVLYELGVL